MSEYRQPGLHPDADSLNAFIEGVLAEHERIECLAHLSECARCREIVYLAQEPVANRLCPFTQIRPHGGSAGLRQFRFSALRRVVCAVAILTVVVGEETGGSAPCTYCFM